MQFKYHISSRTKILGWAYNAVARNGIIDAPGMPDYIGTIRQICQKINKDRQFQADRETLRYRSQWFYGGEPIVGIDEENYATKDLREIDILIKSLDRTGFDIFTEAEVKTVGKPLGSKKEKITLTLDKEIINKIKGQSNKSEYVNEILKQNCQ